MDPPGTPVAVSVVHQNVKSLQVGSSSGDATLVAEKEKEEIDLEATVKSLDWGKSTSWADKVEKNLHVDFPPLPSANKPK